MSDVLHLAGTKHSRLTITKSKYLSAWQKDTIYSSAIIMGKAIPLSRCYLPACLAQLLHHK